MKIQLLLFDRATFIRTRHGNTLSSRMEHRSIMGDKLEIDAHAVTRLSFIWMSRGGNIDMAHIWAHTARYKNRCSN